MTNTALNRALQSKPSSFPPGALRLAGVLPTGMVWVTSAMQVALTHPPCCRRCLGEEGSRKADYCCLKVICGRPPPPRSTPEILLYVHILNKNQGLLHGQCAQCDQLGCCWYSGGDIWGGTPAGSRHKARCLPNMRIFPPWVSLTCFCARAFQQHGHTFPSAFPLAFQLFCGKDVII